MEVYESKSSRRNPGFNFLPAGLEKLPRASIRFPSPSQRNVVVLLPRVLELLVAQHGERAGEALAG